MLVRIFRNGYVLSEKFTHMTIASTLLLFLVEVGAVFPFTNQYLYLHTFSITCNFFLESLSPWLQSVLMHTPLEQHRITAIEFPVR